MVLTISSQLAACVERSFTDPEGAAVDGVRVLMTATRSANGFVVLALRQRGRPRKNARDALLGYRAVFYRRAIPPSFEVAQVIAEKLVTERFHQDPLTQEIARRSHRLWTARLRDRADAKTIRAYLQQPVPRALHLRDRMYGALPLGAEAFVVLALDRYATPGYRKGDAETLANLLRVLEPSLQRLAEHHGVFAGRMRLSPREVEVYRLLKVGRTDKEIAQATGLSVHTAHDLVRDTLRKLELSGRPELMREAMRARSAPALTRSP